MEVTNRVLAVIVLVSVSVVVVDPEQTTMNWLILNNHVRLAEGQDSAKSEIADSHGRFHFAQV